MRVALFGATGLLGMRIVRTAIDQDVDVRALVRTPDKLGDLADSLHVLEGDYFDRDAVAETIRGTDAVLSTVGPPTGRKHELTPSDFENALLNVVDIMVEQGVSRFINVSSGGTSFEGERISLKHRLIRGVGRVAAPMVAASKEKELAVLKNSGLEWTSLRPLLIQNKAKGSFLVKEDKPSLRVDAGQLAGFMLETITSGDWVRKAPFVGTK